MLLKWLSHILSGLLVASLCGLIISTVLNQTLTNSHYLESQITKANGYNRLSSAITSQVTQQAGVANNPLVTAAIQNVITSAVLKQRVNAALDQLALYYQGKGPAPTINLTDLAAQAQAAGVPLPADSALNKPIKLVPDSGTNKTVAYPAKSFTNTRAATIVTSILLTLALAAISWQRRRYGTLPNVLISVGVLIGLLALALHLGTNLADHYIKFSVASNAFASLGRDLAEDIVRDLARRFSVVAASFLVVGVAARLAAAKLQAHTKRFSSTSTLPKNAVG